jgi:glycosyltransferase involved in cell wall biosynthesis
MKPKISVILTALNEEKLLPRCLDSLKNQTYPRDKFETILVDNGSTDKTSQIGNKYGVKVIKFTDIQGCGASRQFGAEHAKGDILAFTDPDSVASRDWLEKIDTLFRDPKIAGVGGQAFPDRVTYIQLGIFKFYDIFHRINHLFGKPLIWGFNMAFKKAKFDKVGGINKHLKSSEDWEISFRMKKKYGSSSMRYIPDLKVYTSTRKNEKPLDFLRYAENGIQNYVYMCLLGKTKAKPMFHIR